MLQVSTRRRTMVQGRTIRCISGSLSLVVLALLVQCARERSLQPRFSRQTIYVSVQTYLSGGEQFNRLYLLDADSLNVLDSIQLGPLLSGAASPDGHSIYIQPGTIEKYDLVARRTLWSNSSGFDLRLVDEGRRLFVSSRPPECATLQLSAENGSLLGRTDGPCRLGSAPAKSDVLPVVVRVGDGTAPSWDSTVQVLDVSTGEVRWTVVPRQSDGRTLRLSHVELHPDGKRLLTIGACGSESCVAAFTVHDARTGVALLSAPLVTLTADMAVSADGRYAVVSNPSYAGEGPQFVDIFDLRSNALARRLDLRDGLHPDSFGDVLFLPDDRRVLIAPNIGGPLQVIDLQDFSVGHPWWLPPDAHPSPEVWAMFTGPRL